MEFTEITEEGWLSRIMGSIKGVLVGALLVLVSFPVLFWNEGRSVKRARALDEGAGIVAEAAADAVDPSKDKALVYVSGEARPEGLVRDEDFGVEAEALKLRRVVAMYQWKETRRSKSRKKIGGGKKTVTTYSYDLVWSEDALDSDSFHDRGREEHRNPPMPLSSKVETAPNVALGAYTLSSALISELDGYRPLRVDGASEARPEGFRAVDGGFYRGENSDAPALGDVRVRFQVVEPGPVSVVAGQSGSAAGAALVPYQTESGGSLAMIEPGKVRAEAMFAQARDANAMLTWILRGVGFFLMLIGIAMVFRPIAVVADVVPLFGDLLGAGIGLFATVIAASLSTVTIAVAWVVYRPLLGAALLLVALGIFIASKKMFGKKQAVAT